MEYRAIEFPFKSVLSIAPLVAFWDQILSGGDSVKAAVARAIREGLKNAPELLEPIEDLSILEKGCIFADSVHCKKSEYEGSIFHQAVEKGEPLVIEDLQTHPSRTALEEKMIQGGLRSVFVTSLHFKDKLLGPFDLKSPHPGALNALNTRKLWEILPLFSMALNRGMEELNHRVQAIIKEKCTAIHPSVEWRFQRAALNYMQREDEVPSGLEPIVFRDVYPLYGVSDIRGSSEQRNVAIQTDLIDHLKISISVHRWLKKRSSISCI